MNRPPPTGTFTKKMGKVKVILFDQEDDAKIPTYGQRGLVTGKIYLENHELILSVILEVTIMSFVRRLATKFLCLD